MYAAILSCEFEQPFLWSRELSFWVSMGPLTEVGRKSPKFFNVMWYFSKVECQAENIPSEPMLRRKKRIWRRGDLNWSNPNSAMCLAWHLVNFISFISFNNSVRYKHSIRTASKTQGATLSKFQQLLNGGAKSCTHVSLGCFHYTTQSPNE